MIAYSADRIFTGTQWLLEKAILADRGRIEAIVPVQELPADISVKSFGAANIVPAFIDLQIYGASEKLFSVFPEPAALTLLNQYCRSGGAAWCMPTVATNTYNVFHQCIDAVRTYWQQGGQGVLGLHIEGPWINAAKRGAHIESLIHTPTVQQVKDLLEYGRDVIRIITLAPEICSQEIIALIASYGIVVSAGHSNATEQEARTGFGHGITAVTHLYNAMSPLQHRAPGLAGAAMDDKRVMASIIPDSYHVDYTAVRIAKEVMKERLFVITDAVTTTTSGEYQHYPAGDKYEAAGILSGSALTMNKAVQNLVAYCDVEIGEALRMCSLYPARVMGMDKQLGKIEPGYDCCFAVLDNSLEVVTVVG